LNNKFEVLGNNLRVARKEHKMSQERLGELADLSARYIGQIENGEVNPSFDVLYKLKSVLGVSFNVFYTPITDKERADIQEITNSYRSCQDRLIRQMMVVIIRALADAWRNMAREPNEN